MNRESVPAPSSVTAFPGTDAHLAELLAAAPLDRVTFQRPIARCDLGQCKGMCCYDGVYVNQETAETLQQLADARRADFSRIGAELPERVVVEAHWREEVTGLKTAVKPWREHDKVPDYPAHFEPTTCVFHLDDGRCSLQVLAEVDGRHSWYYKPLTCWLHPIDISRDGVTLHDEATDPYRFPDYDGYVCQTHCGRTTPGGMPALRVLAEELSFLGRLVGRDLLAAAGPDPA